MCWQWGFSLGSEAVIRVLILRGPGTAMIVLAWETQGGPLFAGFLFYFGSLPLLECAGLYLLG